ncbi:hypothetical protein M5689_013162 [Euphorbia peplus]|nr:hypothetical protein M5689_013162 [Euphorbia peplus]
MLVPIGVQVSGFEDDDVVDVVMQHLCVDKEKAESLLMGKTGKKYAEISPKYLKMAFETVPTNLPNVVALEPYVKAYLLYLIGLVLFPNKSNTISILYLPLLQKEKINKYAWGAAVAAYLKFSMARACIKLKDRQNAGLDGFSYAILAFALERFSTFRGLFDRPSKFPLFLGWMHTTSAKFKDTQNVTPVETYKEQLQRLTKEDICWQPYSLHNRTIDFPKKCRDQLWLTYACV